MNEEWSGAPWDKAPDAFWTDDATGEVVCAETGRRLPAFAQQWTVAQVRDAFASLLREEPS